MMSSRKKARNEVRLYNVILPVWLLWIIPTMWLIILPANFIIDFAVFYFALKFMKLNDCFEKGKKAILRIWLFGFLSDGIGVLLMLLINSLELEAVQTVFAFENIVSFIAVTVCVILSGICIYFFDFKWGLKNADLTYEQKKKVALAMAVVTAPYLFYIPPIY